MSGCVNKYINGLSEYVAEEIVELSPNSTKMEVEVIFSVKITIKVKKKETLFNVNERIAFMKGEMQACATRLARERVLDHLFCFEIMNVIKRLNNIRMMKFRFFSTHTACVIRKEQKPFGCPL